MIVQLVSVPSMPADELAGKAAALCTDAKNPGKARDSAMQAGHESIAEHANFTFQIEGVSRVLLAQLTRHRIASFSVISQRYCRITGADVIMPETVKRNKWHEVFEQTARKCVCLYQLMIDDDADGEAVPKEDARYILPMGITCKLMLTMNARELRHFFQLRTCNRAQWEIRALADEMLRLCKEVAPALFADAGCACMVGKPCPEGKRTCGKPRNMEVKE